MHSAHQHALDPRPRFDAQRWTQLAWTVWLLIVLGLAVYAFLHPSSHTVYDIYSAASRRWLAGEDAYIRTREYYRYSPAFAIALSPLAVLPDAVDDEARLLLAGGGVGHDLW